MVKLKILCCLILIGSSKISFAQSAAGTTSTLAQHLQYYAAKKSNTLMFVHLDKTVYVNNENIWFTAYLLNCNTVELQRHQVLSVALIDNNDQQVAASRQFTLNNGIGSGNIAIPDSVPPGNYSFIAYTNLLKNGHPAAYFVQVITLKSATVPSFDAEIIIDTSYNQTPAIRAMLTVRAKSMPVDGAVINYYLGKDAHTRIKGKAKTNVLGMYDVLIPKSAVTSAQHMLEVQIKSAKETKTMHLDLPLPKQLNNVRFYPEGGHLVNNIISRVGWEAKLPNGLPLKTQAVLLADNRIIDTIETDSYGMGEFYIMPMNHAVYQVKLLQNEGTYTLPDAIINGIVTHMRNALVNDTLNLQIAGNFGGNLLILIHNYRRIFTTANLNISPKGKLIKIALNGIPRGLNTVTILDSLQRPCAEQVFFAHYNQKPSVAISLGSNEYKTRQKVAVKIQLNDALGKAINGVVSVACAQDNRFELKNENNIEHYVYLQDEIDDLPLKDDLMGNAKIDRNYLNKLLLIRGWSKYKWPEVLTAGVADTAHKTDSLIFKGNVTWFGKKIKKPAPLIIMKEAADIKTLVSDNNGNFVLNNTDIITPAAKKISLLVGGKTIDYTVRLNNPYGETDKSLAQRIEPVIYQEPLKQSTSAFILTGFEHATKLREVKIMAANDNNVWGLKNTFGVNECGDYVCRYNVLNCPNHPNEPDNRPAKAGEKYQMPGHGTIIYTICTPRALNQGAVSFNGINQPVEFYGEDYSKVTSSEPDYISTIFWKNQLLVNADNTAEVSFYTSDITGKFRIVVQGITGYDVVYGQRTFEVKKAGK